jgi:hypothetical protein
MTACLMDFSGLTDPDQIIAAAREASRFSPDPTKKPLVLACKTPVGHKCLVLPVDQRLEKVAQRLLASYSLDDRVLGAKAVVPFQSDANAALLQPLLRDTRSRTPRGAGKWQLGHYHVRDAASDVLEKWTMGRPELLAGGSIYVYAPLAFSRATVTGIAAVVLVIVAMSVVPWRGRRIFFASTLSLICIGVIIAISILWSRSRRTVDEVMFTLGSGHHEIASYRGGIQYMVMHEWTVPMSDARGTFDLKLMDDVWSSDTLMPKPKARVGGFMAQSGNAIGPAGVIHPTTFLRIPYWALLVPFPLVLLRQLFIMRRHYRRRRLGLCQSCGYDLRGSAGGRCSECGAGGRSLLAVAAS